MNTQVFIDLENQYGAHNYKPLDVVLGKGAGVWVWDVDGHKYMDCLSGYAVANQGHCHPKILKAMTEQASELTICSRAFRSDKLGLFYKTLCDLFGMEKVLPMNSGAEAVETAIKTARKWGYLKKDIAENQAEIIVCDGNFHGRTTTIISFSSNKASREGFGPFMPGFKIIPYGDAALLEAAITPNTVAFLVEPIQGEGGIIIPPSGYLKAVRKICSDNNVLLVLDEIQTGMGRTGKWLDSEYEGITADMVLVGKSLSGGFYPVSAALSKKDILGVFKPGEHGSTYGGNPLACAISMAAVAVLKEEKMLENSVEMGAYFMNRLKSLKSPLIKEIRGRGLMIGMELVPEAGGARKYCQALKEKGILCKDTHENTIRITPSLTITKEDIDWAIVQIDSVC